MKHALWVPAVLLGSFLVLARPAWGQDKKGAKKDNPAHVKKDIADHRAMADAHLAAAKCLESGQPETECQAQLARDCKGLGIGKYCGMKHRD
jgi:hypothetical protein